MEELTNQSASALARAIHSRQVSSQEVIEAYLRRISQVNPKLNAVVQLTDDKAREQARKADEAVVRGEKLGPLHGVPITIKDTFDTAGIISTGGTKGRAGYVPTQDATAVARLKAAGAIILGKTNLPELSLAFETDNLIYGRTNNPYDLTRTSGGSSGGEAAIIAAGGSPLGLGTDAAGSLRVPSHFCGITSLKSTLGRVPTTGAFPPAIGPIGRLWQVGPLASHVEDLFLALQLISGPDWNDSMVAPIPLGDHSSVDVRKLRIAYYTDNGIISPSDETVKVVDRVTSIFKEAKMTLEEARPTGIEQTLDLTLKLFGIDDGAGVQMLLQLAGTKEIHPLTQRLGELLHPFAPTSTAAFGGVLTQWDMFKNSMLSFIGKYDAIVCPVCAYPAMRHGTTFGDDMLPAFSYTMPYNLTGWPAAVVRGGTSPEGLPIGVQVVARPWREDVALAVAQQIETALGGWQRPSM